MLDRRRRFVVGSVLGHVVNDLVRGTDSSFLDEQPESRGSDRLGRGHRDEDGLIRRRLFRAALHGTAEGPHRGDLPVASDRHLAGGKDAVSHVALGAIQQRLDLVRVETYFRWAIGKELVGRHVYSLSPSVGNASSSNADCRHDHDC